jgi:hypothetical protein
MVKEMEGEEAVAAVFFLWRERRESWSCSHGEKRGGGAPN